MIAILKNGIQIQIKSQNEYFITGYEIGYVWDWRKVDTNFRIVRYEFIETITKN